MSRYTTTIKTICESITGEQVNFKNYKSVVEQSIPFIFLNFPIFKEDYKNGLCAKILEHYFYHEIGVETVGQWKMRLNTKLNEIMPYYNKLYLSELIKFDPFINVDYTEEIDRETMSEILAQLKGETNTNNITEFLGKEFINNESSGTNTNNGNTNKTGSENGVDRNYYSNTPQNDLTYIEQGRYLTDFRKNTDDRSNKENTTSQNTNVSRETSKDEKSFENRMNRNIGKNTEESKNNTDTNTNESIVKKIIGKNNSESYVKLLQELRESYMNIDMMVINELQPLFMSIW
jgi:hypothetical protein